jgi:hypothetical protein
MVTIAGVLIVSGIVHLALLGVRGEKWEGPVSLRKPGLFGISTGLTCWSLAWVGTRLYPLAGDAWMGDVIAVALLIEVGLITMQYWRGVGSHFNRSTPFDAGVETAMLVLILAAVLWIFWLCIRSIDLPPMQQAMALAIRGGLWLLFISCILGGVTTVLGHANLAAGRSPVRFGAAGVLKYPHGIVLHAIQVVPLLAWLLDRLAVAHAVWLVGAALASQVVLLIYALWQTFSGRSRFDVDRRGAAILAVAGMLGAIPVGALVLAAISI